MLKPAILYKDEIQKAMAERYYTEDMMFYTGDNGSYNIDINDNSMQGDFRYASVDKDGSLVGYIGYSVDFYGSCAYNFGIISFQKGNLVLPSDLRTVMDTLLNVIRIHRIEWRAVSGNPACRAYDRFCHKHGGSKLVLHDVFKDATGRYRNSYIYEIIQKGDCNGMETDQRVD